MTNSDTVSLLKECDAGTKMAVSTIDEVLEHVKNSDLKELLQGSKADHTELGNRLHSLLISMGTDEKDPSPMAKGMSWIKTNMKISMEESDAAIADLITDGCNMGIKSLYKYRNQFSDADELSKEICVKIADIEERLAEDLRKYLI